jgi:integrase
VARSRPRIRQPGRHAPGCIPRSPVLKAITKKAGLGENWTPRELRHSFVSIMSDNGVPIETIADLVGHASTAVTEEVYRHQLKPVITKGAETMNTIFTQQNQAKSA